MTKETIRNTKENIIHFFCSDYFLAFLAILVVFFWATGWEIFGTAVIVVSICLYMWIGSDLKPFVAVVMFITMMYSLRQIIMPQTGPDVGSKLPTFNTAFVVVVAILVPIIIISLVYNLWHFRSERQYNKGRLFYGLLIAYIGALLSGIAYSEYNKVWTLAVLGVGLGIYLVYFICINCVKGDLRPHICKIVFFAGLIVAVECIIWFIRQPDFMNALLGKSLRVGWGMSNTLAVVFVMAVPAVIWLGLNNKIYSYVMFPAVALFGAMLMMTLSRGNILFGGPIMAISCVYGFIKAKLPARIVAISVVAIGIIILLATPIDEYIVHALLTMNKGGFLDPNGRERLYEIAINNFKENPIFGVGFFKPAPKRIGDGPAVTFLWKTHNTFFQIISCMGIVGTLCMVPFYVQRYWGLLKKITCFKFLALLAVLGFELEGLVDLTFLSVHELFLVLGLLAAAESETIFMENAERLRRKTTPPTIKRSAIRKEMSYEFKQQKRL
ncbi:MAG: O-antigen ligase family protein [Clostridiales bacterium]|nr:O-antigen ligase family protein [Clostridiales bacterium]